MDLAAESLRLTLLRYQAGEATALEVVDAQNTVNAARNAYDDGLARYESPWPLCNRSRGLYERTKSYLAAEVPDPRGVACLIIAAVLLWGCGKAKSKEDAEGEGHEPPTPVTVETAGLGAIDRVITADAVLYPINQANVTPKINAPVKRMLVNRGDHVRAGQVLAELESADLAAAANESQSQYEQSQAAYQTTTGATVVEDKSKAEADVRVAQQVLDAAQKLHDNRVALQKEGALAQKLVDDARVALAQARGQPKTRNGIWKHLHGKPPAPLSEQSNYFKPKGFVQQGPTEFREVVPRR